MEMPRKSVLANSEVMRLIARPLLEEEILQANI